MPSWYECTAILMSEAPAIQHCAIASYPEGELLASKGDGRIHDDELMAFVHAFDNTCKERTGYGFILDDIHYKVIYTGRQCIAGRNNSGGFFATKIHCAVIIAVFEGSCTELGQVRISVDKLADILIAAGY